MSNTLPLALTVASSASVYKYMSIYTNIHICSSYCRFFFVISPQTAPAKSSSDSPQGTLAFLGALVKHFVIEPKSHGGKQKDKEWERLKADNEAMKSEVEGALLLTKSYKAEVEALKASAAAPGSGSGADMDKAALQALVPQLESKNQQLTAILNAGAMQLRVLKAENEELKAAAEVTAPVTERLTVARAQVDRSETDGLNAAVVAADVGAVAGTVTAATEERLKSELEVAMKQSEAYKLDVNELRTAAAVAVAAAAGTTAAAATIAAAAASEERLQSELEVAVKQSQSYKLEMHDVKMAAVVATSSAATATRTITAMEEQLISNLEATNKQSESYKLEVDKLKAAAATAAASAYELEMAEVRAAAAVATLRAATAIVTITAMEEQWITDLEASTAASATANSLRSDLRDLEVWVAESKSEVCYNVCLCLLLSVFVTICLSVFYYLCLLLSMSLTICVCYYLTHIPLTHQTRLTGWMQQLC
jgi:hypothetical protein